MSRFPEYVSHISAKQQCFNCDCILVDQNHTLTDYPEGRWSVKCPKCGFTKFYDIKEKLK